MLLAILELLVDSDAAVRTELVPFLSTGDIRHSFAREHLRLVSKVGVGTFVLGLDRQVVE